MAVRVRPDVWKLKEWDDVLVWYARAVREMQQRPIADPTSWRYQAAIHDYFRDGDPLSDPADVLPSATDQARFWKQCQHGSWYFLPWHRLYLGFFEQIVAATIRQLGGPADWMLPYWNYSARTDTARRVHPAFRAERLPDGTPNPLRVNDRAPAANSGGVVVVDSDVDIVDCLDERAFTGASVGTRTGFGGPETPFSHNGGLAGKVEATPHGDVHVAVGGVPPLPVGYMSRFNTAGLDPLFWLHHANIDRLWNVWRKRRRTNTNPTKAQWLDQPQFEFHDATGAIVSFTSRAITDSETSPFTYRYEDESDPLMFFQDEEEGAEEDPGMAQAPQEMVGATESRTLLKGRAVTARVPMQAPSGPAAEADAAGVPGRVYVNIENIKGAAPVPHLVYINLPEGADPAAHPERLAGSLSMFGLPEASGADPQHPGSGLTYSLDVTRVVERLGGDWTPGELRVTLVPRRTPGVESDAAAPGAIETPTIEVGRISVYRSQ